MPTPTLTHDILNAAIEGLEQKKLHLDSQIADLRKLLSGEESESTGAPKNATGKRQRSPESIQRMREGQRRRWARQKGTAESQPGTAKNSKAKRKLSAAGKAAIVAALKKRWAAKREAANQ